MPVKTAALIKEGTYTVVLVGMADGKRLKPFVVFKGMRPKTELDEEPGVVVADSSNDWMNKTLTKDWILQGWEHYKFWKAITCLGCIQMPRECQKHTQ